MKAPGRSTVSPYLLVDSVPDELHFLKIVFGAERSGQRGSAARTPSQVTVELGNSILLIGKADKQGTPATGMLYVWTDDVEGTYARAMKEGATLISAPTQASGVREAGFADPQGHIWWVGQRPKRPSSKEVERLLTQQRKKRL